MSQREPVAAPRKVPWYQGRLWHGMSLGAWCRLLVRNRLAVSPSRWSMAATITLFALGNTLLGWLERLVYGGRVDRVRLDPQPVFIVGHWRTGTTLLHELLALDPRHTFSTTYSSFAANHFLVSERIVRRLFWWLLPTERPMDNMRLDFARPQEDECALANLGLPSPFLTVAFPNRPLQDPAYVDLDELDAKSRARWQAALVQFLRRVTFRRPGRLILKSPQHTFRIRWLLETFPEARFVYLVRDPYVVYRSTRHFWRAMYESQALQKPRYQGLDEQVLTTFIRMHSAFEASRDLIPAGQLHELRYEDLVADPIAELRRLYERLDLGDFAPAEAAVRGYLAETREYRTNRYVESAEERAVVARRWRDYIVQHGYAQQ